MNYYIILFGLVVFFMILTGCFFLKCARRLNHKYDQICFELVPKSNQHQYLIDCMDTKQHQYQNEIQAFIDRLEQD